MRVEASGADVARDPDGGRRTGAGGAGGVRRLASRHRHGLEPRGDARRRGVVGAAYAVELSADSLAVKSRWGDLKYVGISRSPPPGWSSCCSTPAGAGWSPVAWSALLAIPPAAALAVLAVPATHDLVRFYPATSGAHDLPHVEHGAGVLGDLRLQQPAARGCHGALRGQHGAAGPDLPPDVRGAAVLRPCCPGRPTCCTTSRSAGSRAST